MKLISDFSYLNYDMQSDLIIGTSSSLHIERHLRQTYERDLYAIKISICLEGLGFLDNNFIHQKRFL